MRELFRKYLDNNCSPAEVKRLLAYFNIAENEIMLRRLITEWLEENKEEENDGRWKTKFYRALGLNKMQLSIEALKGKYLFPQMNWTIVH
jgi:hypothetical protein